MPRTKLSYAAVDGPDQVDPDKMPPHLAPIILRCVKNNPEERYFSADEILADL